MLATLFAERVILGKTLFDAVPNKLKLDVAILLKEAGAEYLITDPEIINQLTEN